jgi:hypothetical protein
MLLERREHLVLELPGNEGKMGVRLDQARIEGEQEGVDPEVDVAGAQLADGPLPAAIAAAGVQQFEPQCRLAAGSLGTER